MLRMRFALRGAAFTMLAAVLLLAPAPFLSPAHAEEVIEINLGEEPVLIEDFLRTVSRMSNKQLVWNPTDKNIRGKKIIGSIRLRADKAEFMGLVRSLLTFYELVMIPVGPPDSDVILIMDARQTSSILKLKPVHVQLNAENLSTYENADGLFITTTIQVENMQDLRNARNALTRIVTGQNIGNVTEVPSAKAFVVTDFAPSVCAIYRLLKEMDLPSANSSTTSGRTISVFLEYAKAGELAKVLAGHFAAPPMGPQNARAPQPPGPSAPRISADARTNKLLITGDDAQIAKVKEVIAMMDVPVELPNLAAHYKRLEHIDAQQASHALVAFIATSPQLFAGNARPSVVAHEETNALLISADRMGIEQILRILGEMDQPEKTKKK